MQETYKVFVYGTLLRGFGNHDLLMGSTFVGEATTDAEFDLVNLGAFPAMVANGDTVVRGEVYEINDRTLGHLDRLEGIPHFYYRDTIVLSDGTQVMTYLMERNRVDFRDKISSGSWKQHRQREGVLYAY